MTEYFEESILKYFELRKLTVWKVTFSSPVFSFVLSLTEKLLIARLRINKILDTQRRFPLQKNTNGQR